MYRLIIILTLIALTITSCGGTPASDSPEPAPVVLASTTFLADMARNVAGDRVTVESLLPVGADPHSYQPTPQDAARIAGSQVLIINGMDYEHFIESLLENAGGERIVVTASDGVEPLEVEEHADETESGSDEEHEAGDPHMWLDPNLVIVYVENIREGLTHYDPEGAAEYQANADKYIAELQRLDAWIAEQVAQIPAERRLLVTNHEALNYFAQRYGFAVVGTVVESFSTDASPSAQQMAALIDQMAGDVPLHAVVHGYDMWRIGRRARRRFGMIHGERIKLFAPFSGLLAHHFLHEVAPDESAAGLCFGDEAGVV